LGTSPLAQALLNAFWDDNFDVEAAAALCWLCIDQTTRNFPLVGGPVQLEAIFKDPARQWGPEEKKAAEKRGVAWRAQAQAIPWK
jgi:hypothetical protein